MTKRTRQKLDAALKAKIALEALREQASVAGQCAQRHGYGHDAALRQCCRVAHMPTCRNSNSNSRL